jgi:hypothetical protein
MKPKLPSWNVRGLNEGDKCLRVKNRGVNEPSLSELPLFGLSSFKFYSSSSRAQG